MPGDHVTVEGAQSRLRVPPHYEGYDSYEAFPELQEREEGRRSRGELDRRGQHEDKDINIEMSR